VRAMNNGQKKVKAYEVYDGNDGWTIQFATNGATARREGANELNCEWEDIDHCRRKPELDQYAPGPVPLSAMLEIGWWYECNCCSKHCYADNPGVIIDENAVYCNDQCSQLEWRKERDNARAKSCLIELFESKFHGATITHVYVSGTTLEPMDKYGGARAVVTFMFPGGVHTGTFHYGDAFASVMKTDAEAFECWHSEKAAA